MENIFKKTKSLIVPIISIFILISCGTLGGIGPTIYLNASKQQLKECTDQILSEHPRLKMPQAWEKFNDWEARGYSFLESKIFYFDMLPREMYLVTLISDSSEKNCKVGLGIRAINKGSSRWLLSSDLNDNEKERILLRFEREVLPYVEKCLQNKKDH